jgi:hypothetical protein
MVLIVGAAVGLAALRNANVYWATAMAVVLLVVVGTSLIGAIALRGREQFGWIGFAVFSVLYLGVTVGNFLSDPFKDPFRTWALLDYISQLANPLNRVDLTRTSSIALRLSRMPGAVNANEFVPVGQCLFAMLSGLVGSVIGKTLHARRERSGT